jgi:hypothetical protein
MVLFEAPLDVDIANRPAAFRIGSRIKTYAGDGSSEPQRMGAADKRCVL